MKRFICVMFQCHDDQVCYVREARDGEAGSSFVADYAAGRRLDSLFALIALGAELTGSAGFTLRHPWESFTDGDDLDGRSEFAYLTVCYDPVDRGQGSVTYTDFNGDMREAWVDDCYDDNTGLFHTDLYDRMTPRGNPRAERAALGLL